MSGKRHDPYIVSSSDDDDQDERKQDVESTVVDVTNYTQYIPRPKPTSIDVLERFWRSTNPGLTVADTHAYGEATAGSLWKIWQAIESHVTTTPFDVILDWGMGAGKMVLAKQLLTRHPSMLCIGIEISRSTYEKAISNLNTFRLTHMLQNIITLHGDSRTFTNWAPVTIAMQYDGGTQPDVVPYHYDIMHALFRTATVRIVFSTKLNDRLFHLYFDDSETVRPSDWRLVRIHGLSFGQSSFIGNLWIRINPVVITAQNYAIDPRIQAQLPLRHSPSSSSSSSSSS